MAQRSTVEATIRQWLPFMALSEADRDKTRNEWIDKYFSLPTDMDPSQLPYNIPLFIASSVGEKCTSNLHIFRELTTAHP